MARLDDLPPDHRAVLQLLLKQGKTYEDLAGLLRTDPESVRGRAHDALVGLGPLGGATLSADEQEEISDYLLGQQTASERASTRQLLETSPDGRAWARIVAGELRPLAGDALPEIPAEGREVDEAWDALAARQVARQRQAKSSRLGGFLLLGAVGLAVAFLIVFLVSGGDDDEGDSVSTGGQVSTTATGANGGTSTTPQVIGQVNLNPVKGSPSKDAAAAVTLVRQGDEIDILFQGQDIPPNTKSDVYALWVVSDDDAARLGFTPRVKANGRLRFPGALPPDIDLTKFQAMALTKETTADPKTPGQIIIAGALPRQ
jgi:hypothetical protein